MTEEAQRETVAFLSNPKTHGGAEVETIATHASRVFMAGDRAYKLKRAVKYSYLDFSTPDLRRKSCEAELRLNRRTAPNLYLDVQPITRGGGGLALGGEGEAIDWVVVMRRFPQEALFSHLAEAGKLTPDLMRRLADRIAAFHREAEVVAAFGGIAGVELWKALKRRGGSTGVVYVVPLSVGMIVGRIGCQLAGLEDMTYGAPTTLPWSWDFGDGIPRHPSPLYESLAMLVFLAGFFVWFRRAPQTVGAVGFYVFIAYYAAQRFLIEFTKPYGDLLLGLDLFQIGALLLFGYALFMITRRRGSHAAARA